MRIAILYQGSGLYIAAPYLWQQLGSEDSVEDTEFGDRNEDYTAPDPGLFLFVSNSS